MLSELIGTEASFGIALGDILYNDLSFYDLQNSIVSQVGIPFYNIPGNHDENYDTKNDFYATETFKRYFGPTSYSFEYGKVHFCVLDDIEYLGRDEEGKVKYQGKIGERQLEWLNNDLKFVRENKLIVFNMHIPLFCREGVNPSINVVDREKLFKIMERKKYLLVLAGHMHTIEHHFLDANIGWQGEKPLHQIICAAACGAWWSGTKDERGIPISIQQDGTPNGYHIFKFAGTEYIEKFKPANEPENYQIQISFPRGKINSDSLQIKQIVVNVFDGSERSVVKCQIDNLPMISLIRKLMKDPYYTQIYNQSKDEMESWIEPDLSTHIWSGYFPPDLQKGIHKIVVRTKDQFNNVYQTARIFEIE